MADSANEQPNESRLGASILGGLLGTLMILVAQLISPPNEFSKWLMLAAPTAALAGDRFSIYISTVLKTRRRRVQKVEARAQIVEARAQISEFLTNPITSAKHKQAMIRKLEVLEQTSINFIAEDLIDTKVLSIETTNYDEKINALKGTSQK